MFNAIVIYLTTVAVSWMFCNCARRLLTRANIVDLPNRRSSHTQPTVRGGGIGILAGLVCTSAYLQTDLGSGAAGPLLWLALWLAIVSFVDDFRGVSASLRFGCQSLISLTAISVLGVPGIETVWCWPSTLLMYLWIAGYTNAFNFMDGINGIASCQAAINGVGMAILSSTKGQVFAGSALFSLLLSASALGFLPHNFPKAKMFMGDVGSAPLGFLLAATAVWIARDVGWSIFPALVLLHANFVLDTGITLIRRVCRGERWYEPHREHFYQRLVRAGCSHVLVTSCEMSLQMLCLGLMLIYVRSSRVGVKITTVAAVLIIWGLFFVITEIEFRRSAKAR